MESSRRAFLLKLARGAAYSAPLVVSMSAPDPLRAQAAVSHKKGGNKMGGDNTVSGFEVAPAPAPGPQAPWTVEPPGGGDPPGGG
jgi:hypothetical protein